jgi:hypothetical protein
LAKGKEISLRQAVIHSVADYGDRKQKIIAQKVQETDE